MMKLPALTAQQSPLQVAGWTGGGRNERSAQIRHVRSNCIQVASAQFAYPLEQGLEREALPIAKMRGGRHRATRALWAQPTHAA